MRRLILLFLVVLIGIASIAQTKRATQTRRAPQQSAAEKQQLEDDMQAISSLHNRDIEASLALDEVALESLWTDDIVTLNPGSPAVVGKAANVARLQASIEQMKKVEVMAYNEEFQEVRIQGDWAYEWGVITGRKRPFSGGNETSYKFNVMRILQRQPDGAWKIARSIYNDTEPVAPPKPAEEKPKEEEQKNKLKD